MKKFGIVYGIVIGMAVLAVVVAFRYGAPAVRLPNPPSARPTITVTMTITSPAFRNNEYIPRQFSCEGGNKNPVLQISGVPDAVKSLALIMHDPDAPVPGGFTHWAAWNINPQTRTIQEGGAPDSGQEGLNDRNKIGYTGPCPPVGHGVHHYHFKLYALDTVLNLSPETKKVDLEKALVNHIVAEAELVGLYERK